MAKVFVGSTITDKTSTYHIIYDYTSRSIKLLNSAFETMTWAVPREFNKRTEPIQEWEMKQLYGGRDSCDVSHITDGAGQILFPKAKTYKVGDRFVSLCGETYILAAATASKALLINLRTGWRYDDGFDVDNLQRISEENIPAGLGFY